MKNKEEMMRYQVDWHKKNDPGPGVIGSVPKLAEGAVNPMWAIQENIESIAEKGVEALKVTAPKKLQKKNISVSGPGLYLVKTVEVDTDLTA